MFHAPRFRFGAGMLAEKIVLLCGGQTSVAVGRTHHAELIGVRAQARFEHQTILQRLAGIFTRQHVIRLHRRHHIEVAYVPGFVIGKFIVG